MMIKCQIEAILWLTSEGSLLQQLHVLRVLTIIADRIALYCAKKNAQTHMSIRSLQQERRGHAGRR